MCPEPRRFASRESRPAPPDWSAPARPQATALDLWSSDSLGLAVTPLVRLALDSGNRQTGDCDRLASQGFPALLELEQQASCDRAQIDSSGGLRPDPNHVRGKSSVGSAPDSWRTAQTRDQAFASHRRQILRSYFDYYQHSRTHLSLAKDAPEPRPIQPPQAGDVIELPQVGGLHHRYERRAA